MKSKITAVIIFILSLALTIIFFVFRDYFEQTRSLGLLGLFIINAVSNASLFISAPAFLTVIAGGAIYPPVLVALIASFGSAVGDMVGFLLGLSGRHLINHKLNEKIWFKVINTYFHKYGGWIIFIIAFVPNPFFDSLGIIAGVFHYRPWKFFLLVFIGRFFRYLILAEAGSYF